MSSKSKAVSVTAACAALGTVGGLAGAAAAPSSHHTSTRHARPTATGSTQPGAPRFGGPAVHEDAVILDKAGSGFITATIDNGSVGSVSGDTLSVKEGIGTVMYKTVALTIPAGATIMRNFKTASLSDLKAGDRVHVRQSSDGTTVFADDGTARPPAGGPAPGGGRPGDPGWGSRGPGGPGWGPAGPRGPGAPGGG